MRDKFGKEIERRNANQRAYTARNRGAINARLAIKRADPEYRAKLREADRKYSQKNRPRAKNYQLMRKYGITLEDFERRVQEQDGRCAVCRKKPQGERKGATLHVDHDHQTGWVRGLLCDSCNRGIGLLGDNSVTLAMAARYVERTERIRESA
jgi:hypothetical protein